MIALTGRTTPAGSQTRPRKPLGVRSKLPITWSGKNPWSVAATRPSIRLNAELAKKPAECLEYIVVHELVHLLEPTHNARFVSLMDRFMPKWQFHRQVLNRLPVRREKWSY